MQANDNEVEAVWLDDFTAVHLASVLQGENEEPGYLEGAAWTDVKRFQGSLDRIWPVLRSGLMDPISAGLRTRSPRHSVAGRLSQPDPGGMQCLSGLQAIYQMMLIKAGQQDGCGNVVDAELCASPERICRYRAPLRLMPASRTGYILTPGRQGWTFMQTFSDLLRTLASTPADRWETLYVAFAGAADRAVILERFHEHPHHAMWLLLRMEAGPCGSTLPLLADGRARLHQGRATIADAYAYVFGPEAGDLSADGNLSNMLGECVRVTLAAEAPLLAGRCIELLALSHVFTGNLQRALEAWKPTLVLGWHPKLSTTRWNN